MARNVTADYTTTPQLVPDGVQYTTYRVSLHRASDDTMVLQSMVAFDAEATVEFPSVMPGSYYVGVALSSADGEAVGPSALSAEFEVPDDDAALEVPMAVSVTVHPMGV